MQRMTNRELLKTVTNLGSPKVLLVGDFMLDIYIYGDALRISPEAPVPVLKVIKKDYAGGGASSVAADISALGGECLCLGVIGNDNNARELISILNGIGADTTSLIQTDDRPTITKTRLVGMAQHRHRQQLLRVDEEVSDFYGADVYESLIAEFEKKVSSADIVCLQDYKKGLLESEFVKCIITIAKSAGKKILVDPPRDNDYSKFKGASVITPNRQETSIATGIEINSIDDAHRAADILAERLELEAVVITLDRDGAFLRTAELAEHIPTKPRTVYDVTGAGDMVLAMLAAALSTDCDYRTAVILSNLAGGIEVEKFGVATVSIDEIVNEIISDSVSGTGKIYPLDELVQHIRFHRQMGRKIVFTNGCFDILHPGHIEYLNFCKQHGDIVVVGLNSDASVKQIKGPGRPVNNQHDRASVLAGLESVDYITIFDEPTPLELIKAVRPDVLIKGQDWEKKGIVGADFVESYGGKIIFAPLVKGKSTTATIEKMQNLKNDQNSKSKPQGK